MDRNAAIVLVQLLATRGIGPRTIGRILDDASEDSTAISHMKGLSVVQLAERYGMDEKAAQAFSRNEKLGEEIWEKLQEKGVTLLAKGTPEYPAKLSATLGKDAPPVLFALGSLDVLSKTAVGFTGSRKASDKGLGITAQCAGALAANGLNIVSGYAKGVDLVAHCSALEARGVTTVLLAEGILHFRLKSEIKSLATSHNLLVLSEFSPRLPWSGRNAMTRNRTICGLAEAMVLVESGTEGGTFECGKMALELRRPLFVVEYAEPPDSAAGNPYFLAHGGKPLRRNRTGQPNLDDVIKAATEHLTPARPPHDAHPLLAGLVATKLDHEGEL